MGRTRHVTYDMLNRPARATQHLAGGLRPLGSTSSACICLYETYACKHGLFELHDMYSCFGPTLLDAVMTTRLNHYSTLRGRAPQMVLMLYIFTPHTLHLLINKKVDDGREVCILPHVLCNASTFDVLPASVLVCRLRLTDLAFVFEHHVPHSLPKLSGVCLRAFEFTFLARITASPIVGDHHVNKWCTMGILSEII